MVTMPIHGARPPHGPRAPGRTDSGLPPIDARFLLCVRVPFIVDGRGRRWVDPLWAKDLALHTRYLDRLVVAAPVWRVEARPGDVSMRDWPLNQVTCVDLPEMASVGGLAKLPSYLIRLWRALGQADVVQAGFASWPIPEGIPALLLARMRRRFTIAFVESSFWRRSGPDGPRRGGLIKFALGPVLERAVRWTVRHADLRVFTSRAYRQEMLGPDHPRSAVNVATWIDARWILRADEARAAWRRKRGPVRLLCAGRLVDDKGVPGLLRALSLAGASGCDAEITLVGEGELREQCETFVQQDHGALKLRLLDPIAYGEAFLELVRQHDAVLLPSMSDEQPRLPFDAFSQAVPVIGFDTGGLREVVMDGVTGRLARRREPEALADLVQWAAGSRAALEPMGMAALESARSMTHEGMHAKRHAIYSRVLGQHGPQGPAARSHAGTRAFKGR